MNRHRMLFVRAYPRETEIYTGDLRVVSRIDMEEGELAADFDGRAIAYGFGGG